MLRPRLQVVTTHLGLSKRLVKDKQLELLGGVDTYGGETAVSSLAVFCSDSWYISRE